MRIRFTYLMMLCMLLTVGCGGSDSDPGETDGDTDTTPSTDGDAESDSDGDAPADGDPDGDAESEVEWEPEAPSFAIVPFFPATVNAGTALSETFTAENGTEPYTNWRVVLGDLPSGVSLDAASGVLSGTSDTEGFYYFVVAVDDAAGETAKELFGLRIGDPQAQGAMAARADAYQDVYEARHIWDGWVLNCRQPDDPNGDYQLSTFGDSAFMGGQCTAAMAFRDAVLGSPESAAVVKSNVDAYRFFQRMTGVPGLIGRSFAHKDSPSEDGQWDQFYPDNENHRGEGEFADYYWKGDTSRDQVTGAVLGMAIANDLARDPETRQTAATFLSELADHVWDNGLKIIDVDGEVTQYGELDGMNFEGLPLGNGLNAACLLAWIKAAHHATGEERFDQYYRELLLERDYMGILRDHMWVYMAYNTVWYSAYMAYENFFVLMRLEEDPQLAQSLREIFRDTLWLNVGDTTPNRRGVKEHNPVKTAWYLYSTGERDPEALYYALWQTVVFPEAPLRDRHVENSSNPDIVKNPDEPSESLEPLASYQRKPDMVIWHRNPYELDGGADSGEERTGCDYMLPYWMGRYYGFISEEW